MKKALIQLHTAVFLAGFTGILGKLIELNEGLLVWYRMLITVITLAVILGFQNEIKKLPWIDILKVVGVGGVVALHWVTFYGSIKYSNVSIALVCFSSIGFFTAIFEPILLKRRFEWRELALGLLCIAGIYLIFNFNPQYKTGIIIGLISALLAVFFSILNKSFVARIPVKTITFYEMGGGWLVLTLLMPFYMKLFPTDYIFPTLVDWIWLLILAWLCTVWAVMLQLSSLKKLSTFTSNLTYNLEPVYGILLAFILFKENENLSSGFYYGLALILLSVFWQMWRIYRYQKY
ncbi:MAG: EamA family transporter [Chitinophagaceae bacterium]|jgi:drug/metabolite transporter (DMT)-like permease|nr:EamA family transporter [Chitinophagaceae bacterium]